MTRQLSSCGLTSQGPPGLVLRWMKSTVAFGLTLRSCRELRSTTRTDWHCRPAGRTDQDPPSSTPRAIAGSVRGDRVAKTTASGTTAYTLDLASALPQVISETTGSATSFTAFAGGPLELDQAGTTYWYQSDTLGSARLLTDSRRHRNECRPRLLGPRRGGSRHSGMRGARAFVRRLRRSCFLPSRSAHARQWRSDRIPLPELHNPDHCRGSEVGSVPGWLIRRTRWISHDTY
jgi:hypothetical protein